MEIILGKGNLTFKDIESKLTYNEEDAERFIITDLSPIANTLGNTVSYLIGIISIGTLEIKMLRIIKKTFDKFPLKQGDIIKHLDLWEARKGYHYLISYKKE